MIITDRLRGMLKTKRASLTEALSLLDQVDKNVDALQDSLKSCNDDFHDLEKEVESFMKPETLLEEQAFAEFYKRIVGFRNGQVSINEILYEFKLL